MASTPKKTKYESIKSGYIVKVSPVKTSQNNNKYFNATFQTSTCYEDLVNFKPESHRTSMEMSSNRTPVTLHNIDSIPSRQKPGQFDVKFSSFSRIEQPKQTLPFAYKELPEILFEGTIEQIKKKCTRSDKVTLSAKVQYIGPMETVPKGDLKKTLLTVADHTDAISMAIWNEQPNQIKLGLSYKFSNISIRIYNNQMSLCTSLNSTITSIQNLDEATIVTPEQKQEDVEAVTIENAVKCNYCKSKLEINELLPTTKCTKCNKKMLTKHLRPSLYVCVTVNNKDYTVPEPMLQAIYEDCLEMQPEQLEDRILLETRALIYNRELLGLVLKE